MAKFQIVTEADLLKYTMLSKSKLSASGCWEWQAGRGAGGYGAFCWRGSERRAHRISYEAYKGAIPDGMVVRHTCDNPACINPDHLTVGTMKDNAADRQLRGRGHKLRGETVGTAKLTEKEVLEIRASSLSLREVAEKYGIDHSNAWAIRAGKSWKHLSMPSVSAGL